ncbi:hypothetical protein FWG76_00410 [Candidatus Saccharibacteria bacterium]|nr:hypothetical protein [Candidatus Saccharibacteria bacterium]
MTWLKKVLDCRRAELQLVNLRIRYWEAVYDLAQSRIALAEDTSGDDVIVSALELVIERNQESARERKFEVASARSHIGTAKTAVQDAQINLQQAIKMSEPNGATTKKRGFFTKKDNLQDLLNSASLDEVLAQADRQMSFTATTQAPMPPTSRTFGDPPQPTIYQTPGSAQTPAPAYYNPPPTPGKIIKAPIVKKVGGKLVVVQD